MANDKGVTIKVRTWVLLLAIVLLAGFATYKIVKYRKDVAALEHILKEKDGAIRTFSVIIDGMKEEVRETNLLYVSSHRALKKSEQYAERLKKQNIRYVNAIGSLELKIAAMEDSLKVVKGTVFYDTVINEVVKVDDRNLIELPASFGHDSKWAESWGIIYENGLGETGFKIKSLPINITLGHRGWLKPSYVALASSPNPLVDINTIDFVITQQNRYKPILIGTGLGVVGGVVLGILIAK